MTNKTAISIGLPIGNIISIIITPDLNLAITLVFTNIAILALATNKESK